MDICWNCWELNSQFIKFFFIVPTIGLLLEITAQGIRCILFPQLLKFLKIHFEAMEPCFLEYINTLQRSTHSNGIGTHQYAIAQYFLQGVMEVNLVNVILGQLYTRSQGRCSTQIKHSYWCKSWNWPQGLYTRSQSWNRKNIFNQPQVTNNAEL